MTEIPKGWPEGPWEFRRIDAYNQPRDGFGYVSDALGRDILHVGERTCTEAENVALGELTALAPTLATELEAARARIAVMEAALGFYAEQDNYRVNGWLSGGAATACDGGQRARAALSGDTP